MLLSYQANLNQSFNCPRTPGDNMGMFIYSDNTILLAPDGRRDIELMLRQIELFAAESSIHFSTDPDPKKSKSNLIFVCGRQPVLAKPAHLILCPTLGSCRQPTLVTRYISQEK